MSYIIVSVYWCIVPSWWCQNVGMSMVGDLQRLQDISQELAVTIHQPNVLPERTVDYIAEVCPLATQSQQPLNNFQGTRLQ